MNIKIMKNEKLGDELTGIQYYKESRARLRSVRKNPLDYQNK